MSSAPNPTGTPITGPVVKITLEVLCQSVRCQTSWHYVCQGAPVPPATDLTALLGAWNTIAQADLVACLPASATLVSLTAAEVWFGLTPTVVQAYAPATVGSVAGSNLPLEMGVVLEKVTALKGKHGRGRFFLPAVPISFTTPATDPNLLNAAAIAAYDLFRIDMKLSLAAGAHTYVPWVVASPIPPANNPATGSPVTNVLLRTLLATVRRRKPGRGI